MKIYMKKIALGIITTGLFVSSAVSAIPTPAVNVNHTEIITQDIVSRAADQRSCPPGCEMCTSPDGSHWHCHC